MFRKRLLMGITVLVVVIATPIGWYLLSPLFITREVDESFPVAQAALVAQDSMAAQATVTMQAPASDAAMSQTEEPNESMATSADAMMPDMASPTASVESMTTVEPKVLRTGQFHAVAHEGSGSATIYELPDGKRVLRLENFEVLNGPDLYVYVSAAPDANDEAAITDAGFVSLGALKGNKGNQNYELPADFDLSKANSVTIWCRQFSVNFATAPLK